MPTHKELSADGIVPREEHKRFLRLCEICERFALYLHAKPNPAKAEEALKKIIAMDHDVADIAMGHDVADDGSVFDCATCWQEAKSYQRTGRLSIE